MPGVDELLKRMPAGKKPPVSDEGPAEAPPQGGHGLIAEAEDQIEELAGNGELSGRVVKLHSAQTVTFDIADYPELADEQVGNTVVFVGAGIVTRVPRPEDKKPKKGADNGPAMPSSYGRGVEIHQTETAIIHGSEAYGTALKEAKAGKSHQFKDMVGGILKNREFKARPGETREEAAAKVAATAGRKEYGKERFQALATAGRKAKA